MCSKPAGTIRSSLLPPLFLTLGVRRHGSIIPKNWKDHFGKTSKSNFQTDQIAAIAKRHPDLKLVLCHMGQPSRTAERDPKLWSAWLEQIRLGTLPNVWFDLSALPYHVREEEEYPFPSTKRYFDLARRIVGAEKLLWGTDIPWLLGTANYQQLVAHGRFLLADCTEKERDMMFAGNAWDVYWNHRK